MNEWINCSDAAEYTGKEKDTVKKLFQRGKIVGEKRIGKFGQEWFGQRKAIAEYFEIPWGANPASNKNQITPSSLDDISAGINLLREMMVQLQNLQIQAGANLAQTESILMEASELRQQKQLQETSTPENTNKPGRLKRAKQALGDLFKAIKPF